MLAALPFPSTHLSLLKNFGGLITYERIDGLETGLHGLVHGLSGDDAWGLELNSLSHVRLDGSLTVDGVTKSINDSAEHTVTNGDVDDGTGSLNDITLLDLSISLMLVTRNCQITIKMERFSSRKSMVLTYRYRGRQYQHYQFPS